MRRGTFIMIVVLFVLLLAAGIAQIVIAGGDRAPLQGPTSPGQLPSLPQPSP
jgi:flagellar basal body-associated protein FliL